MRQLLSDIALIPDNLSATNDTIWVDSQHSCCITPGGRTKTI